MPTLLQLEDAPDREVRASYVMERERLTVTDADRQILSGWIRAGRTPQRVARRARIVLLAAEGCPAREIARRLGVSSNIVSLWRRRFQSGGPAALTRDAPGRGRKVTVTTDASVRLRTLLATPPPAGRWTVRALASAIGISRASVHRVLKATDLALTPGSDCNEPTRASRARHETAPKSALI